MYNHKLVDCRTRGRGMRWRCVGWCERAHCRLSSLADWRWPVYATTHSVIPRAMTKAHRESPLLETPTFFLSPSLGCPGAGGAGGAGLGTTSSKSPSDARTHDTYALEKCVSPFSAKCFQATMTGHTVPVAHDIAVSLPLSPGGDPYAKNEPALITFWLMARHNTSHVLIVPACLQ